MSDFYMYNHANNSEINYPDLGIDIYKDNELIVKGLGYYDTPKTIITLNDEIVWPHIDVIAYSYNASNNSSCDIKSLIKVGQEISADCSLGLDSFNGSGEHTICLRNSDGRTAEQTSNIRIIEIPPEFYNSNIYCDYRIPDISAKTHENIEYILSSSSMGLVAQADSKTNTTIADVNFRYISPTFDDYTSKINSQGTCDFLYCVISCYYGCNTYNDESNNSRWLSLTQENRLISPFNNSASINQNTDGYYYGTCDYKTIYENKNRIPFYLNPPSNNKFFKQSIGYIQVPKSIYKVKFYNQRGEEYTDLAIYGCFADVYYLPALSSSATTTISLYNKNTNYSSLTFSPLTTWLNNMSDDDTDYYSNGQYCSIDNISDYNTWIEYSSYDLAATLPTLSDGIHNFLGWSTDSTATSAEFKGSTIVDYSDLKGCDTLYAVWKTYTWIFHKIVGDEEWTEDIFESEQIKEIIGTTQTAPSLPNYSTTINLYDDTTNKGSYTVEFDISSERWYDYAGSADSILPGATINFTEDRTLEAWYYSTSDPLPSLTKTGYTFLGWSKTNGTSTIDYAPGETLDYLTAEYISNLYAVWKENQDNFIASSSVGTVNGRFYIAIRMASGIQISSTYTINAKTWETLYTKGYLSIDFEVTGQAGYNDFSGSFIFARARTNYATAQSSGGWARTIYLDGETTPKYFIFHTTSSPVSSSTSKYREFSVRRNTTQTWDSASYWRRYYTQKAASSPTTMKKYNYSSKKWVDGGTSTEAWYVGDATNGTTIFMNYNSGYYYNFVSRSSGDVALGDA